ncbi:hypothetical protein [Cryptosporangium sp. NPDC051539]|uniref:hypothetical protein n=1 Tax=Cryptosporangium sp. NPDC051539 TaxID=3363962 RepID=UPI0037B68E5E
MSTTPLTRQYLTHKLDLIIDAGRRRDGAAGSAVLRQMYADGHGQAADTIAREVIDTGLRNLARTRTSERTDQAYRDQQAVWAADDGHTDRDGDAREA